MPRQLTIESKEEQELKKSLEARHDPDAERLKRFLAMRDLSRTPASPLAHLAQRIIDLPRFADFKALNVPEIIDYKTSFDLFNFPADHPARQPTDTYFVDKNHVLRTHTTVMWYYHVNLPDVQEKIKQGRAVGALCHGKVYRKDEIDRQHMNVFHQMDGWYLCDRAERAITINDLQDVLIAIAQAIFGEKIAYKFNEDSFPYTDPSIEMELKISGRSVEILGAGVVRGAVLENLGVDSRKYNGWAFGFGLERLAIIGMNLPDIRLLWSSDPRVKNQLKLGQKYVEVSKYPPITRDISFVVAKDFIPNNYFDLIRDIGGNLVEEVKLLDQYDAPEKFGSDKVSYTYRIVYRAPDRTLVSSEIDSIQDRLYRETAEQFKAELR